MKIDRLASLARGPAMTSKSLPAAAYPAEPDPPGSPTRHRRQHGQDIRQANVINDEGVHGRAFRVASSLFALRKSGEVGDAEVAAAERWYRDYVSSEGAHDPEHAGVSAAHDVHNAMIARINASARRTDVRRALGFCGEIRLRYLMVDCLSFTAMALVLMPGSADGRKKVSAQMILLLEMLVEHYVAADDDRGRRSR